MNSPPFSWRGRLPPAVLVLSSQAQDLGCETLILAQLAALLLDKYSLLLTDVFIIKTVEILATNS